MTAGKSNIRDYIIAILLVVVLGLSAALFYITDSNTSEPAVIEETTVTNETTEAETDETVILELSVVGSQDNQLFEDMESGMSFCFVGVLGETKSQRYRSSPPSAAGWPDARAEG